MRAAAACALVLVALPAAAQESALSRMPPAFQESYGAAERQFVLCVHPLFASADGELLLRHDPHRAASNLDDPSFATDDETRALREMHAKVNQCRREMLATVEIIAPTLIPIYLKVYRLRTASVVRLAAREITWGQHNRNAALVTAAALDAFEIEISRLADENREY